MSYYLIKNVKELDKVLLNIDPDKKFFLKCNQISFPFYLKKFELGDYYNINIIYPIHFDRVEIKYSQRTNYYYAYIVGKQKTVTYSYLTANLPIIKEKEMRYFITKSYKFNSLIYLYRYCNKLVKHWSFSKDMQLDLMERPNKYINYPIYFHGFPVNSEEELMYLFNSSLFLLEDSVITNQYLNSRLPLEEKYSFSFMNKRIVIKPTFDEILEQLVDCLYHIEPTPIYI